MKVEISNYNVDGDQTINVRIDDFDTWSIDHTLAPIILPMLKQLKETTHGSPIVDDEDVPHLPKQGTPDNEAIQRDFFSSKEQDELFWGQYEQRWNWILDEMIYAFDCKVNLEEVFMRYNPFDDSFRIEQERISNGFRLFGKYFESLWD
jgi:hypothetical protein